MTKRTSIDIIMQMGARTPNCQTFSLIDLESMLSYDEQRGFSLQQCFIPGCIGRRWLLDLRVRSASPTALKDQRPGVKNRRAYRRWKVFLKRLLCHFLIFINLWGVRRGFKMIPSRRAPSRVNTSPYRAIWTHFRPTFISVGQTTCQILVPKSKCFY